MNFVNAIFNVRRGDWGWMAIGALLLCVGWACWDRAGVMSASPLFVQVARGVFALGVFAGFVGLTCLVVFVWRAVSHEKERQELGGPWDWD